MFEAMLHQSEMRFRSGRIGYVFSDGNRAEKYVQNAFNKFSPDKNEKKTSKINPVASCNTKSLQDWEQKPGEDVGKEKWCTTGIPRVLQGLWIEVRELKNEKQLFNYSTREILSKAAKIEWDILNSFAKTLMGIESQYADLRR